MLAEASTGDQKGAEPPFLAEMLPGGQHFQLVYNKSKLKWPSLGKLSGMSKFLIQHAPQQNT